jgi:hypothetical protein
MSRPLELESDVRSGVTVLGATGRDSGLRARELNICLPFSGIVEVLSCRRDNRLKICVPLRSVTSGLRVFGASERGSTRRTGALPAGAIVPACDPESELLGENRNVTLGADEGVCLRTIASLPDRTRPDDRGVDGALKLGDG